MSVQRSYERHMTPAKRSNATLIAAFPPNHTTDHGSEGRGHDNFRHKLRQTAALFFGEITLGFFLCLVGPSLLDLQISAHTDTKSIAMVFVGRAIGGVTGSVLFAFIFDKCHPWYVLSAAYATMATSLVAMPWIGHVVAVTAMYGLGGVGYSISDAGSLVMLLSIWGPKNGPWVQAIEASFYIGCTFAPLLVEPFLSIKPKDSDDQCYGVKTENYNYNLSLKMFTHSPATTAVETDIDVDIWKPYLIAGVILVISTVVLFIVGCVTLQESKTYSVRQQERLEKRKDNSERYQFVIICLIAMFMFLSVSMQRGVRSFLLTYVVHCLGWNKSDAAYLKTAFKASSFCGRSLGILAIKFIPTAKLIGAFCVVCMAAVVVMVTLGGHVTVMWLSTICIGLSISPTNGYCVTWGSQYVIYTGKVGAVFTMMGALSDLVGPLIINLLYDNFGLATYPYYILVLSVAIVICYGLIVLETNSRNPLDRITQECEIGGEVGLPLNILTKESYH